MFRVLITAATAVTLALSGNAVVAQSGEFPNKPIRLLVPFAAGSGADGSARVVADQMQRLLGQSIVVENRPGGSGAVAAVAVKTAPADGYTILVATNSPMSVNTVVMKNPGYDAVKDFKPVHGIARSMNLWYAAPDSPIKSISDLLAKAKGGGATVGSYSAGYQLVIAWLAVAGNAPLSYVPYKGQAQVITDVLGKVLDVGMGDMTGAIALVQSGKIRALAVSGDARHPSLPDVPTVRESGIAEYATYAWTSFYVRADTPADVHSKLVAAMKQALITPEVSRYFQANGSAPMTTVGPDEMAKYQLDEIARFKKIADAAGIKPE